VNDVNGELSKVLVETDAANAAQNYYAYGMGLVSQGQAASAGRAYPLEDGLGNVRLVTSSTGAVTANYNYDPFGNLRAGTGTAATNYRFSGEQLDPESSLYFLRARYYDPVLGRFISRDPVAGKLTNPQSQNPYAYALNNPNSYADPSGQQAQAVTAAITAACTKAAEAVCKDGDCTNEARYAGAFLQGVSSKLPGVYKFLGQTGKDYVGKSVDLIQRIGTHISTGKLTPDNIQTLEVQVADLANLRVLEQTVMNQNGGKQVLENVINSVAPQFWQGLGILLP